MCPFGHRTVTIQLCLIPVKQLSKKHVKLDQVLFRMDTHQLHTRFNRDATYVFIGISGTGEDLSEGQSSHEVESPSIQENDAVGEGISLQKDQATVFH